MKKDIHPKYYDKAETICSCGEKWNLGSTKKKTHVELCSQCHPFYTGNDKIVDTAGKVERFQARAAKTKAMKAKQVKPKPSSRKKTAKKLAGKASNKKAK